MSSATSVFEIDILAIAQAVLKITSNEDKYLQLRKDLLPEGSLVQTKASEERTILYLIKKHLRASPLYKSGWNCMDHIGGNVVLETYFKIDKCVHDRLMVVRYNDEYYAFHTTNKLPGVDSWIDMLINTPNLLVRKIPQDEVDKFYSVKCPLFWQCSF